jgi:hypothetical protein
MMNIHPSVAYDMVKVEQQQRNAKLELRRHLMDRDYSNRPAPQPHVQAVRRATFALAGAGLALTAVAVFLF